jgi:hypothetical protein
MNFSSYAHLVSGAVAVGTACAYTVASKTRAGRWAVIATGVFTGAFHASWGYTNQEPEYCR